jgi:hypothetical protein
MKWIQNLFPTAEQRIFLNAAKQEFDDICRDTVSAADIYRKYPDIKNKDWKSIRRQLLELSADPRSLTLRFRGKLATVTESLVTCHFYTNLVLEDRELWASSIGSTCEIEDRIYYFKMALDYSFATILKAILLNGWTGDNASKSELKDLHNSFIESCQSHCKIGFELAKAVDNGMEVEQHEKESFDTA